MNFETMQTRLHSNAINAQPDEAIVGSYIKNLNSP